jgi:cytochrome P450
MTSSQAQDAAGTAGCNTGAPFFPMSREAGCPFDPPLHLREAAANHPVSRVTIWNGSTPWIITGHAEQRALLSDPRVSVNDRLPGFPHWHAGMEQVSTRRAPSVFNTDPPEHTRFRRMMTAPFTFKRVNAMRAVVQEITDDLIDQMLAGPRPADLVEAIALPLPTRMICTIMGVPYEDHATFSAQASIGMHKDVGVQEQIASFRWQHDYLADLVKARMAEPRDDVVSDLAQRVTDGEITVEEAAAMGVGLFVAGHETSSNMIALATVALLEHPDQLAILRDSDDPQVTATAVEELLRYLGIVHMAQRRIAKEDIEIGGQTITAGEGILIELASANRDPRVFPDPDVLDLHRPASAHHAFGFGLHQCIGQQLARVELQVVYGTLFRRIPTLSLATTIDQIEFKHDGIAYGVYHLPVTW